MRRLSRRVLVVQNQHGEGPGLLAGWLDAHARGGWSLAAPGTLPEEGADPASFGALLVLGGPQSHADPRLAAVAATIRRARDAGRHTLGVCLGAQLLARAHGARVRRRERAELGVVTVTATPAGLADPVVGAAVTAAGVPSVAWHGDEIVAGDEQHRALAVSELCGAQAVRLGPRALALQFHPELEPRELERWFSYEWNREDVAGLDTAAFAEDLRRSFPAYARAGEALVRAWLRDAGLADAAAK